MGAQHSGNVQPSLDLEEHTRISGIDGRKVFVFDNAGNQITSFGGSPNTGNVTLNPSPNFIGIVSVANTVPVTFSGNVTLSDAKTYIGLTTATIGNALVTTSIVGNVTLSDSKGFIGLVSIAQPINANVSLGASAQYIGIVSLANSGTINANVSLGNSVSNIGFATVRIGTNVNTNIGLVTVDGGTIKSLVSLGASEQYIGLATVKIGTNVNTNIGLVTVDGGTVKSLVSLGASVQNIGFATVFQSFPGGATIYTQVISLTSLTTIAVAPASNMFFIKNLHVSSLGRSEVEIRSGATTLIPWTSLSTTSGFFEHYGEYGLPSRAQADGLVVNLAVGSATISVMANVRYGV